MGAAHRLRDFPDGIHPPASVRAPSYSEAFEVGVPNADGDALAWARSVFEDAPGLMRGFLRFGWRFGLGLRLAQPGSEDHVIGWRIVDSSPGTAVIEQSSGFLRAAQVFRREPDRVIQATFVEYDGPLAHLVWPPASLLHRRVLPYLLGRAVRRRTAVRS